MCGHRELTVFQPHLCSGAFSIATLSLYSMHATALHIYLRKAGGHRPLSRRDRRAVGGRHRAHGHPAPLHAPPVAGGTGGVRGRRGSRGVLDLRPKNVPRVRREGAIGGGACEEGEETFLSQFSIDSLFYLKCVRWRRQTERSVISYYSTVRSSTKYDFQLLEVARMHAPVEPVVIVSCGFDETGVAVVHHQRARGLHREWVRDRHVPPREAGGAPESGHRSREPSPGSHRGKIG